VLRRLRLILGGQHESGLIDHGIVESFSRENGDEWAQLTLDGGEVTASELDERRRRAATLSEAQAEILRFMVTGRLGWIRSSEAGVILHAHRRARLDRRDCGSDSRIYHTGKGVFRYSLNLGCCEQASSDGTMAMRRLAERGLVERIEPGTWVLKEDV
jgi:hypothetical protein